MSLAYDTYLKNHIQNVKTGCDWILRNISRKQLEYDICKDPENVLA